MYKKIFSTSIINAATSGVNILSSYIIVKLLSLEIFGEFAVFSSFLAFGGLIYAIIPPNFSIFKLQDDKKYKTILLSFFILSSIIFLIFVALMNILDFIKIDIITVYLFGISTFYLGYFDIKFQAFGQLNKYFLMLFVISILKAITLGAFYYLGYLNNLTDLLWAITIVKSIVLFVFTLKEKKDIIFILKNPNIFKETIFYIKNNFIIFRPYYLNTFLKRIRENVIILIFNKFTSLDIIGLFSIFVKITSFVLGLSRTIEAFFMNRKNINNYRKYFYQKILYFAIFLQFLFLITGLIYLKFFVNEYYFIEILVLSFLVYPHVYFLLARSEMLSNYNNKEVNISELIYIFIVFIGGGIGYFYDLKSIHPILLTFTVSTFGLQIYMIISHKLNFKNNYA